MTSSFRDTQSTAIVAICRVTESSLENARYRVEVNSRMATSRASTTRNSNHELLSAAGEAGVANGKAARTGRRGIWTGRDQKQPPRGYVEGAAKNTQWWKMGRCAWRLRSERDARRLRNSCRRSGYRAGDAGNRVEFANAIDWKTRESGAEGHVSADGCRIRMATYNWDAGTIAAYQRLRKNFRVGFASMVRSDGCELRRFGVTILSGARPGPTSPDDNTLRLTLLYTPGVEPQRAGLSRPERRRIGATTNSSTALRATPADWQQSRRPGKRSDWMIR